MNIIIKNGLLIIIPSMVSLILGWKIGTFDGVDISTQMNESLKSGMLVQELELLRGQQTDRLIHLKEMELDSALLSLSYYLENDRSWVLYPFNEMAEPLLKNGLIKSAEYRRANPNFEHRLDLGKDTSEIYQRIDQLLEGVEE